MGWGGKVEEQQRARELRASGMTMPDIATALGVSKGSVSLWTRDVPVPPMVRRRTRSHTEHPAKVRAREEVAELDLLGLERLGRLNDQAFLAAGAALYAGEGSKTQSKVSFANTNPEIVGFFLTWLRTFFDIDEARVRMRIYLHIEQDLAAATAFWSDFLDVPVIQFGKPQIVDRVATVRHSKHKNGCVYLNYSCTRTHREVMGLVRALLSSRDLRG
jgi:transcriptional regulator with XRE-family HTH domain